jgi:HTH-type transcriptional regulator/antitoxin MqsA
MSEVAERLDPETGAVLHRDVRPFPVSIGGLTVTVEMPGWYPDGSDDGIISQQDSKLIDGIVKLLRERADAGEG